MIVQQKYYKLSFNVDMESAEDIAWVRERMQKLEKEPNVMKCYQNVTVDFESQSNPRVVTKDYNTVNGFSIYFRDENDPMIERFLFKVKLKFPNFQHEFTHTVKEYC